MQGPQGWPLQGQWLRGADASGTGYVLHGSISAAGGVEVSTTLRDDVAYLIHSAQLAGITTAQLTDEIITVVRAQVLKEINSAVRKAMANE